ncbi:MAG: VTC domain-containing protein [Actinobacteria bacterium]|nr:VTC domain-containing protein [Actinomycetota bacterium]
MSNLRHDICETDGSAPVNLHISVTSRVSTAPPLRERVEQKFFIRPEHMALVLALLSRTCRRDGQYPADQVNSLYFDTFDLEEYRKSDSGDSAKDKIRIRWYGQKFDPHVHTDSNAVAAADGREATLKHVSPEDPCPEGAPIRTVAVWLERKTRRRFASTKQRRSLEVPSPSLEFARLGRGIVPPSLLVSIMADFGLFVRGRMCPVIAISYWRYRFVEPCTGFRVSMDSHIRSSVAMPGIGRGERGLELPGAVVEVKGPVFALPAALGPLADIGSSWTRYSKYASSLDAHAADLGGISRAWPSGSMAKDLGIHSTLATE